MAEASLSLVAFSEVQRTRALGRFVVIRSALVDSVTRTQVARIHQIAPRTVQLWIKCYREKGLAGLADNVARSDRGKSHRLLTEAIQLIERLALRTPPRSAAFVHQ